MPMTVEEAKSADWTGSKVQGRVLKARRKHPGVSSGVLQPCSSNKTSVKVKNLVYICLTTQRRLCMVYLKHLLINFLIVFFANYVLPGIEVLNQTKLPHVGGDILFALSLGFLNASIFHGLRILHQRIYP